MSLFVSCLSFAPVGCSRGSATTTDATLPIELEVGSTLAITSTHELGPALPGTAGQTIDTLAQIGSGPDGVVGYLLDKMIAELPAGTVQEVASEVEPVVAAYLGDRIDTIAPKLATGMATLANDTALIARQFGTIESLQIASATTAVRQITGAQFTIGTQTVDVAFADHGIANIVVDVGIAYDQPSAQLAIAAHDLPLSYGTLIRLGVDGAIVPIVDPGATSLAAAMTDLVDCTSLGTLIAGKVGVGSAATYQAACAAGMTAIASEVDSQLAALDASPLDLHVTGTALGGDRNGDGSLDELTAGVWSGMVGYGSATAPLAAATFTSE